MHKLFDDSLRTIPEGDHSYEIVPGRLTLEDLYDRHCDAFYRAHAHVWGETTQAQHRPMFAKYLKPLSRLYSLPFTPDTFLSFRQQLVQSMAHVKSTTGNHIVEKSTEFFRHLEEHGYVIGVAYDIDRREPDRAEQLRERFSAVRWIGWEFRIRLIRTLLDAVYADGDDAPPALCLLVMMFCGLRTAEALGVRFSDFKMPYLYVSQQSHGSKISCTLKSAQAYRWTPVVSVLRDAIAHRPGFLQKHVRKASIATVYRSSARRKVSTSPITRPPSWSTLSASSASSDFPTRFLRIIRLS